MAKITLYTQPGCSACGSAKQFLTSRGVAFQEINIREDQEALRRLVEDYQSRSTPTLVVGESEKVLHGFNREEYEKALSEAGV